MISEDDLARHLHETIAWVSEHGLPRERLYSILRWSVWEGVTPTPVDPGATSIAPSSPG